MTFKSLFVKTIMLTLLLFWAHNSLGEVSVDPIGISVSLDQEDTLVVEMTLANDGDSDVAYIIDFDEPEEEDERGVGPRRDQPEARFALLWDQNGWSDIRGVFNQEEADYEVIGSGSFDDFDLDEFDCMWVAEYQPDGFNTAWNDNLERFEEWVDGGGSMYQGTGTNHYNVVPIHPGGLRREQRGESGCRVIVAPEDNYWIELNEWDEGDIFTSNRAAHCDYNEDDLDDIENSNWFQVVCETENARNPVWLVYRYGRGYVIVSGTTDTYMWNNGAPRNEYGEVGLTNILYYLEYLAVPGWIMTDPEEGVIEVDDEAVVEIIFTPLEMEEGVYEMYVLIELSENEEERDNLEQTLIQISAIMCLDVPTANVSGTVTDAETENPIEGAMLSVTDHYYARFTDEDGEYTIENAPVTSFEVTVTAADYLPHVEEINIEEEGDFEWNVELLHSECNPSRDEFFMELEPDMDHEFDFTITNGGNGPLTYTTERRLLGQANAEPWELREAENIEDVVQDDMLNGVVFAAGHFFVTGGNNGDDVNKIYKINTDGELVDEFDQFNESRYGMRDLAYDGNLIWGADDGTFYGFTTDCELETTLESPVDIECRSLTWDPDNHLLIASDIATDIYAIDLEGDLVETFERPGELRIYGLGFWPDDPDGYDLYVFCRGDTTDLQVNKLNLEDGDYMIAAELNIDGGRPGGVQITNQLDVYSWVFITLVQNPDRLAIWQLEARKEWFQVEPVEGVIEAEESVEFVLTLDATGLPSENTFEGEIVISHDGVGAETVLSVRLDVVEGEIHTTRNIEMEMGWNLVSANLQPDDEENIRGLMAALVEEELLVIMKNSDGEFYRPDYDYNNIPGWYVNEGYQMLVSGDCVLTLEGMSVLRDRAIPLEQGWQIASYYPRFPIDAIVALSGIVEHLIIAKDGRGNFYLPDWDFSNMGDLREGQGYYLNVDEDIELVYQTGEEANALNGGMRQLSVYDAPGRLPVHAVTGENMSLLVVESNPPMLLQGGSKGGSEIGVYAGGQLVGSGVLQDGVCGIAVWGDDPTTEEIDGAVDRQSLEVRLLIDNGVHSVSSEVLSGKTVYRTDSFAAIHLNEISELPSEFGIVSAYPNPFNARTRIVYGLPEAARVDLAVYDLSGRRVYELASGRQEAGIHTVTFDGSGFASGIYMVHLEAGGNKSQWKVALVK